MKDGIDQLIAYGMAVGAFMSWHHSDDEYEWIVAEMLLRRTTRTAAEKAFHDLMRIAPTFDDLAVVDAEQVERAISWTGLGEQRTSQLKQMAKSVVLEYGGQLPRSRQDLLGLYGVGEYTADAIGLYVFGRDDFPIDMNVVRVIRRFAGQPPPGNPRKGNPYKDEFIRESFLPLLTGLSYDQIINLHRGILLVAWNSCRPRRNCAACPLRHKCKSSEVLQ